MRCCLNVLYAENPKARCRVDIGLLAFYTERGKIRAIPHNSKCRYGERGTADAKPKAQIILCVLSSILATQMPCRTPSRSEALRSATAACGGSWRGDPPERCLSRKAGIVRCCLCYRDSVSPYPALLCGFNQIPEALRLLDQFIQDRNIIITALLRHLSDAALIAG